MKWVVHVRWSPALNGFGVEPGVYGPFEETVEADWSQAAFWYAAISHDHAGPLQQGQGHQKACKKLAGHVPPEAVLPGGQAPPDGDPGP